MTDPTPRRPAPEVPTDNPELSVEMTTSDGEAVRAFVVAAAGLIDAYRGEDVLLLDVRGLSEVTNYILIASGTSQRQLKSLSRYIGDLAAEHGMERMGSDRDEASTWVVLDYIDVIIHLFEPATRAHYDLEMLWGDASRVDWRGEGQG